MKMCIHGLVMIFSLLLISVPLFGATGIIDSEDFTIDNRYSLMTSSSSGGWVSAPGEGSYPYSMAESPVSVVATAEVNYHFVHWTGTVVTAGQVANPNSASTTVTMDGNYTLVATFMSNESFSFQVGSVEVLDSDITSTSAVLRGHILDDAGDTNCWYKFRYFKTADGVTHGMNTIELPLETVNGTGDFSQTVTGLDPNCTYRLQATGPHGLVGGAVDSYQSAMVLINCTMADNYSDDDDGAAITCEDSNDVLINCIVWGNVPDQIGVVSGNAPLIQYSDIEGNIWPGFGNISEDPYFALPGLWVDAEDANIPVDASVSNAHWVLGDTHLQSVSGRYDPQSDMWIVDANTSPCINLGDPNSPFDLESDPNGGRVNVGAYGGTLDASRSEADGIVLYQWLLDSDPGWTIEGRWPYGVFLGFGGANEIPDPTSGHADAGVYRMNLSAIMRKL